MFGMVVRSPFAVHEVIRGQNGFPLSIGMGRIKRTTVSATSHLITIQLQSSGPSIPSFRNGAKEQMHLGWKFTIPLLSQLALSSTLSVAAKTLTIAFGVIISGSLSCSLDSMLYVVGPKTLVVEIARQLLLVWVA